MRIRFSLQSIYLKQNMMGSFFVLLRRLTFWAGILGPSDSQALALNVLIEGVQTPCCNHLRG